MDTRGYALNFKIMPVGEGAGDQGAPKRGSRHRSQRSVKALTPRSLLPAEPGTPDPRWGTRLYWYQ